MRGLVVFLGLVFMLGGGALAVVQYAPVDLAAIQLLDQVPGSREFITTQNALYVGAGTGGFGFLLIMIAAVTGRKKNRKELHVVSSAKERDGSDLQSGVPPTPSTPLQPELRQRAVPVASAPSTIARRPAPPAPLPQPAAHPAAATPIQQPEPRPVAAAAAPVLPTLQPTAQPTVAPAPPLAPKPVAAAQPPLRAAAAVAFGAPSADSRMVNRKRVQDLVTINDALKAYQKKNGVYPKADGLVGANERGAAWIPGLSPDFLPEIPRDPLHAAATQYVYVSDGANYKLLAQGVSLVGSGNIEVLGIKIDQTRNPTRTNAAFGFWTPEFAGA